MTTYPTQPTGDNSIDLTNIFASNSTSKIKMSTLEILEGYNNDGETVTPLTSTPDGNKFNYFWYQVHNTLAWVVSYAKALFDNKLELSGGTMTGSLNLGANKATSTYIPTANADLANKLYVDTAVSGGMWLGETKNLTYPNIPALPAGVEVVYADGRALSRTTYASYFALVGVAYGAGDGSTTFNIPDLRGVVARGWDNGRGLDSGRAFGSYQADAIQNIVGKIDATSSATTSQAFGEIYRSNLSVTGPFGALYSNTCSVVDSGASEHMTGFDFDASRTVRTADETRMKNIALYPVIRIK